jgi:two-component system sensor histidine kinase ChvG
VIISGIEDRVGQVVRNLLDNAVSFSPPGGRVELGIALDAERVILTIADEGPGLPEENLEKAFDRFYTLRPEAEAFGTHSGLGLSISRQIVEAHGGTIRATNRRDKTGAVIGATFVVELPVRK